MGQTDFIFPPKAMEKFSLSVLTQTKPPFVDIRSPSPQACSGFDKVSNRIATRIFKGHEADNPLAKTSWLGV